MQIDIVLELKVINLYKSKTIKTIGKALSSLGFIVFYAH